MEKFIRDLSIFTLFVSFVYVILVIFWGEMIPSSFLKPNLSYNKNGNGQLYTRIQDIENHQDVDILFLGSSHTYRGFDPRIFSEFGFQTFNLGSSAQGYVQTELLLNRYFNRLNPKNVMIEVFPSNFESDGIESSLDIISAAPFGQDLITSFGKVGNPKIHNTLVYSFYKFIHNTDTEFVAPMVRGEDTYIPGGFVERFNENQSFGKEEIPKVAWEPKTKQIEAFERIVQQLVDNEVNVILVYAPITTPYYERFVNGPEIMDYFHSFGLPFYDGNLDKIYSNTEDFYDFHHLNQSGVEKFNRILIKNLKEKFTLR